MDDFILKMEGISKSFPGVKALDNVSFDLKRGEILALIGENGAGKSTLMKILSGVYRQNEGKIILEGNEVRIEGPSDSIERGIAVIYQELNLSEDLTVAENIYLGREMSSWWNLNRRGLRRRAEKLLSSLNFPVRAGAIVRKLNVSERQLVEIARAMASDAKIIVMDEPTATITEHETSILFKLMRELKEKGVSIVFVSHKLEEVFEIADRVTILRDGSLISSAPIGDYTGDRLIKDMVGRRIDDMFPKENFVTEETVFAVDGLSAPGHFENVSFEVKRGEILGIAGLVGSGKGAIALAIYGGIKATANKAELCGKSFPFPIRPDQALSRGVILIPEDRKTQGLVTSLSITKNIVLPNTELVSKLGNISWRASRKLAEKMINRLAIKTPSSDERVNNLSGGNQQKVVLAKGLTKSPEIVVFVEPTRGIDVGAKVEVYRLMNELANQGKGIIMISSELPEVTSMSDRVLVMHRGRQVAIFERKDINQQNIISAAMGEQ
ncbi:ABC-type sugar transport system, ATPase component [Mesotoga prima MesG1.Ag.4.2]|uniref:ABC-type sugar transport system, ATPase component n=1 Tax=Mesotoga prima MesG1.Ag.4.2 TaxID=660470 RepID=I2F712_9BACT|nr:MULTISPECIES: sugar ABC transporter ATP-binding protein [Mesotoga]AFK07715.1 ABC-type sugar transport system, ATPase component [Mesotoga prima MesG1.Ag.4.2]MDK2943707.1 ribose transport system ATP-binding protein [Mesotoga sp.]PIJ63639.1 D-ribose transporter ATP-binding protein [Mesotoga sp. H07.pep.5.3]